MFVWKRHASRPDLIHIWVVTPKESYPQFRHLQNPGIFKNGIHVHVTALEDITDELVSNGYKPVWTWKEYGTSLHNKEWLSKEWSTQPLRADVDPKYIHTQTCFFLNPTFVQFECAKKMFCLRHMHPMNHLRFYLPYMQVFKDARRLVQFYVSMLQLKLPFVEFSGKNTELDMPLKFSFVHTCHDIFTILCCNDAMIIWQNGSELIWDQK